MDLCSASPLTHPALCIDRDLSLPPFNRRILEEAEDRRDPLLDGVRSVSIAARDLDEFFELRVADPLEPIESRETHKLGIRVGPIYRSTVLAFTLVCQSGAKSPSSYACHGSCGIGSEAGIDRVTVTPELTLGRAFAPGPHFQSGTPNA